jgi:UDP-glucose 4-epimerase
VDSILIAGGAGYVGSHTGLFLARKGYHVILVDIKSLSADSFPWATYFCANIVDSELIAWLCRAYRVVCVIHCAGFIEVGASVRDPLHCYANNVADTIQFLKTIILSDIKRCIFSSSAAVYGPPYDVCLAENHSISPLSPYGMSKAMVENILAHSTSAHNFSAIALRYFNVAGAVPGSGLSENHDPETHLIPLIMRALMEKKEFVVFGSDYDTDDGTCMRDFVHVWDVAAMHYRAIQYLHKQDGGKFLVCNVGTGNGFSVKNIVAEIERVTRLTVNLRWCARRKGDPARLVADPSQAEGIFQWKPVYSAISTIVETAVYTHDGLFSPIFEKNKEIIEIVKARMLELM